MSSSINNSISIQIKDINNCLLNTSIIKIVQYSAKLLWTEDIVRYCSNSNNSICINLCNDLDIEILLNVSQNKISTKQVYCAILTEWYLGNTSNYGKNSMDKIINTITAISNTTSIIKARNYGTELANTILKLNTCKYVCTTVVPGESLGLCSFLLSDRNTINKFTAEGIIDVMDTIACYFIDKDNTTMFLDTNDVTITCDGSVFIVKYTNYPDRVINLLKKQYIEYVSTWCCFNFAKYTDCNKLRNTIDLVDGAFTIEEISTIIRNLIDIL